MKRRLREVVSEVPLERHYLQLDGVADGGLAIGAVEGVDSDGWSLIFKVAKRPAGASNGCYGGIYDETTPWPSSNVSAIYHIHPNKLGGDGHQVASTGLAWSWYPSSGDVPDAPIAVAAAFGNASPRASRLRAAHRGAIVADSGNKAHVGDEPRTPLHLSVGFLARPDHTYGGSRCAMSYVAAAVVAGEATEDEVKRYSLALDARAVWPRSRLWGYWPASLMRWGGSGWQTPNLGCSPAHVPIAWSGPTPADLVRFVDL